MIIDFIFFIALISNLIFTFIVIYNFITPLNLKKKKQNIIQSEEKISILIPLRNEEENVEECVKSIYNQKLKNFEVICLDDNSTDKTLEILRELESKFENLIVIEGAELSNGWTGKNWACFQLANHSKGEFLLFIDADVRLKENAILVVLDEMKKSSVSMLSVFPSQVIKSLGEYLIVPSMNWLLLTFLPLSSINKFSKSSFIAANGQFIMFRREDYFRVGGHFAVRNNIVEDMELARLMKQNGLKIITFLGGQLIFARMYKNFKEALNGYSKNFFPGFRTSYTKFTLFLISIFVIFIMPIFLVLFCFSFFWLIVLVIIQKILISIKSHQKLYFNLLLLPIQLFLVILIGIRSMVLTKQGKISWKGRKLNIQN